MTQLAADLAAKLTARQAATVSTSGSTQIGGAGAVIGSSAGGDILTGDQNRLIDAEDEE